VIIATRGHRIADRQRYQGRNSRRRVGRLLAVAERGRYNPGMRRPTRFGLAACVLSLVLLGAYTAYWLIIVEQIKSGVTAWAQAERTEKIDISWERIGVGGFPFACRVSLKTATLRDRRLSPAPELRIPVLSGEARPWDFAIWRLAAPEGLSAALAAEGARPPVKLAARSVAGVLATGPQAKTILWLHLGDIDAEAGEAIAVSMADAWVILPPKPPRVHTEPAIGVAVDLRQLKLAGVSPILGDTIDELALALSVKGAVPGGRLVQAISEWRDAGGTIELDNLQLKWGELGSTASGTIALDRELQPVGGFSGAIQGYDQILTALVQSGRMRAAEAGLARLALAMLAKAGPDGKPAITTAFTIQNGQMYLGPAKLGKAPRIAWE
jgi:hypothetical protein